MTERKSVFVFKQFVLEFANLKNFNKNMGKIWFEDNGFIITFSRTTLYEFLEIMRVVCDGDANGYTLNKDKIIKFFGEDQKFIEKFKKVSK